MTGLGTRLRDLWEQRFRRAPDPSKLSGIPENRVRARALPIFGDGYIPPERDLRVEDDRSGFAQVVLLFIRSWPYIRRQVLGHWWLPGKGSKDQTAELVSGEGYGFGYAPFLAIAVAVGGPLLGAVPATLEWPFWLLYLPVAAMTLAMFGMTFGRGGVQMASVGALILSGIGTNAAGGLFLEGFETTLYGASVTVACIVGWLFQVRLRDGRLEFRLRAATHLVYFYAINFTQRGVALALGVILTDLLYQNILQGEPIAPGLAELIGIPEWAQGSITELTLEQRWDLAFIYVYIALGAYFIQLPFEIINPYYNMWILQRINQDLRLALLDRWHRLSLRYHSDHRTGDSIFRIYQDSAQVTAVIDYLIRLTLATMSYFTCVVLVTLLSPWLGLLAGTLVVPAILWARWAMPRMRVRALAYRAAASDVTSRIQETFGTIRLIKAFRTAEPTQKRFEEDSVIAFNAGYRVRLLVALVTIVMFTIASAFLLSGEFMMALWANRGEAAFAQELIALIGVSFVVWNLASFRWTQDQFHEATGDVRLLMRMWMTAQDMAMGLRRAFDILDIEPEVVDVGDAVPLERVDTEVQFEHVRFSYETDRPVLDDVSFVARPGTITAIIGPTGSGKSTLMSLLLRLYDPESGSITIDGRDLRAYQVHSLRSNIAIALQENVLFHMSVRENIRYVAPSATDAEIEGAIRVACMDDYVNGLPNGLDTVLSDRGGKLSTGQRQRLSIARAVVRDTAMLILDEPTAALDAATEHRVMENLAAWGRDRAIFLIAHRISTIRRADNILYLDGGRIVESGSHDELMVREGGRYSAFVEAESNLTQTVGGSGG